MFKWFMVAVLHAEGCLVFGVPPLSAVVMSCLGVWIPPGCWHVIRSFIQFTINTLLCFRAGYAWPTTADQYQCSRVRVLPNVWTVKLCIKDGVNQQLQNWFRKYVALVFPLEAWSTGLKGICRWIWIWNGKQNEAVCLNPYSMLPPSS